MCKCNRAKQGTHAIDIIHAGQRITLIYHRTTHKSAERSIRWSYKRQRKAAQAKDAA